MYSDEHSWAAWMTIFTTKWRAKDGNKLRVVRTKQIRTLCELTYPFQPSLLSRWFSELPVKRWDMNSLVPWRICTWSPWIDFCWDEVILPCVGMDVWIVTHRSLSAAQVIWAHHHPYIAGALSSDSWTSQAGKFLPEIAGLIKGLLTIGFP